MRARSSLVLFAVLVLASFASACGGNPHGGDPPNTAYVYLRTEIRGLDPVYAQDAPSGTCCLQIFDSLYEYEYLKRPYELRPCLAAALPVVTEEGRVHEIRLKEGVRFQDDPCFEGGKGREVTAADVVYSIQRLMDRQTRSPGSWVLEGFVVGLDEFRKASETFAPLRTEYPDVEGLEVLDRYRLRIRLTQSYPQLHFVLAMGYTAVIPWEAIRHYGEEFQSHPVGTGPFRLVELNRSQKVVLERNPTYREDVYPTEGTEEDARLGRLDDAGRRIPFLDRLVFTIYVETQPMWLDFLLGFLDRSGIPKDQYDGAVDPRTRELRADLARRGVRLDKTPEIELIYDSFNQLDPVVGTPNGERGLALRRAMCLAVDEAWWRSKLYNDRVEPMQGILVPEFPEFDPDFVNPWKRGPEETFEEALERARKILADAGMPNGEGVPPIYEEVTASTTGEQFHAAFKRDMARIGLDIRANRVTFQQMLNRVDKGQAQMWGAAWLADYPDAQNFFQLLYGPNAPTPNGTNYKNPEFDRLYDQALVLPQGAERTRIYRRMQEMLVDDCVWNFRYRRVTYDLSQPWFFNWKRNSISSKYGKYLRVDPEMRERAIQGLNQPRYLPVVIALVVVLGLLVVTVWGARRRVRAW